MTYFPNRIYEIDHQVRSILISENSWRYERIKFIIKICLQIQFVRHTREGGYPERIKKTGFPFSREWQKKTIAAFMDRH